MAVPLLPAVPAGASSSSPATVDISGFGYGHGRGMGQWGAFGYASEFGWGYREILAHYYGGTSLGTITSPEPDVTVHLVELDGHNTIASALAGGELVASWAGGAPAVGAAFEVARSGGTQAIFSSAGCAGPWHEIGSTADPVTIASAQVEPVEASTVAASELQACIPGVGARTYQGVLVAEPDGQTQNVVGLEDYIDGVVPAESPARWAALEAQAVAARSYALAGIAATGAICDDTACQMYLGLPGQYGLTADAAVAATAGQVLYCDAGSTCGPAGTVALAEYSASTGGYTAGGAFPAVADLGDSVAANPVHSWTVPVPVSRLESVFPSIGAWESIDVSRRNGLGRIGGRVEQVSVTGASGSVGLTGAQFAADLSLPSNWFVVGPASVLVPTTTPPGATTSTTSPGATTSTTAPVTPTTTRVTTTTTRVTTTTTPASTTTPTKPAGTTTTSPTTTSPTTTAPGPATGAVPPVATLGPSDGYWVVNAQGDVAAVGAAPSYGTAAGTTIEGKVVAMAATPDDKGYWLAGNNGGVLAFGDAHWYGSASALHMHTPFVAMVSTTDGRGYWLVSRNGGVFTYGDAVFYGSLVNLHVGARIVGLATTPDDRGYWLVSSTGAIFAFGDARFYGSAGAEHLAQPVAGMVASPDGRGYFLVARDGGVFAFGDAIFMGSLPGEGIRAKVVAVAPTHDGSGYYVLAASGQVFAFGTGGAPRALLPARSMLPGHAVAIVSYGSAA